MHEARTFLEDLALVFCVAAVVMILAQRLRQPAVLGYLLAGVIVGPHLPVPLFVDQGRIETLSELGVVLVMFSLGLEFSLGRLARVLPTAGITGAIQVTAMLWLGYTVGRLFGWDWREALFAGAMISISSTMIVSRVFTSQRVEDRLWERAFGVLIVQDLAAILLIAVLTTIGRGAGLPAAEVAGTAGRLSVFLIATLVFGMLVIPRLVREAYRLASAETLLIAAVGICFGLSLLAQRLGYSVALGAFLAGTLVSESGKRHEVEHLITPLRDVFAAVFFVSIGMLVDPDAVVENWAIIAVLTALVMIGQSLFIAVGTFLTGESTRLSVRTGMSLAQIGEFSFIIAGVGVATGAVEPRLYAIAVSVSVITTFFTPWLVKLSQPFALALERRLPRPIQTFAALYTTWFERLQARRVERRKSPVRRLSLLLLIDAAGVLFVVVTAAVGTAWLADKLAASFGLDPAAAGTGIVIAACVLAAPFVLGVLRLARRLGVELALRALPESETGVDLADAPRRAFVVGLQLVFVLVVGIPIVAITQPFLPLFYGAGILLLLLVAIGVGFWRSTTNLQGHVHAGAEIVLETLRRQRGRAPTAEEPSLEAVLPGLGTFARVRLDEGSPAVGQTLRDLNLRGLTAASVIAIERAEQGVSVPTGKEELHAGDLLMLSGSQDAIDKATELLTTGSLEGERDQEVGHPHGHEVS